MRNKPFFVKCVERACGAGDKKRPKKTGPDSGYLHPHPLVRSMKIAVVAQDVNMATEPNFSGNMIRAGRAVAGTWSRPTRFDATAA